MTPTRIRKVADRSSLADDVSSLLYALAALVEAAQNWHGRAERDGRLMARTYNTEEVRLIAALDRVLHEH